MVASASDAHIPNFKCVGKSCDSSELPPMRLPAARSWTWCDGRDVIAEIIALPVALLSTMTGFDCVLSCVSQKSVRICERQKKIFNRYLRCVVINAMNVVLASSRRWGWRWVMIIGVWVMRCCPATAKVKVRRRLGVRWLLLLMMLIPVEVRTRAFDSGKSMDRRYHWLGGRSGNATASR